MFLKFSKGTFLAKKVYPDEEGCLATLEVTMIWGLVVCSGSLYHTYQRLFTYERVVWWLALFISQQEDPALGWGLSMWSMHVLPVPSLWVQQLPPTVQKTYLIVD